MDFFFFFYLDSIYPEEPFACLFSFCIFPLSSSQIVCGSYLYLFYFLSAFCAFVFRPDFGGQIDLLLFQQPFLTPAAAEVGYLLLWVSRVMDPGCGNPSLLAPSKAFRG